ncbi:MAG: undecaprenyl-diphosphate phosphatase [Candidatus Bathyarchaeota archaeon]|nr:undecaprenyl-diphosphate phosphatase [Candidatus Bathyarchaeum sp.]
MVSYLEVFILAVVQGITEWLPISSSGHLVITQKALGLDLPLIYSVMLHVGTLIVVLTVFHKDIIEMLKALAKRDFKTDEGKLALFIAIGSIPIAIFGFVCYDFLKSLFSNLPAVGTALLITGAVLVVSEKRIGNKKLDTRNTFLIGLAQAFTIIPGISRSGITVATGLIQKVDKVAAFNYSFLLAVPAILGATIFEGKDLSTANVDLISLLLGVIVSMIVGYISLKLLQKIVMKEKFHLFAYYCWIVGAAILFIPIFQ